MADGLRAVASEALTPEQARAMMGEGPKPEEQQQQEQQQQEQEGEQQEQEGEESSESKQEEDGEKGDLKIPKKEEGQQAAGELDYDGLTKEFVETGKLSDESKEKVFKVFEKAGIPREMLDQHLAGLEALNAQVESTAFSAAGGKEQYAEVVKWAGENLSAADQDAYDAAVTSGNLSTMKFAVEGLVARYRAATGQAVEARETPGERSLVRRTASRSTGVEPIRSRAQLAKLQQDPRYREDPAYRKSVDERLSAALESGAYNPQG